MAAPSSIKVTINEKEGALPGNRVRAVGMCFYKPVKDLVTDRTNRLCRNPDNPKDTSCIEVRDRQRVRATLNKVSLWRSVCDLERGFKTSKLAGLISGEVFAIS